MTNLKRPTAKRGPSLAVNNLLDPVSSENHYNSFLDSIIENIPHMIFVKDAKELRFVRFNKAGEDLLGFSKKEMIGKNDYDFFPKPEADFFTQKDREVLESGQLFDIPQEPIHTRKRGIRILHTKKIPILDEKGVAHYLLGISEDVTDQLRLEKEIAAISDREQKRLGQDLHDGLGQHLTGVAFMSKSLAQKLTKKNLPEQNEAIKIADLVSQAIFMTRNLARMLNPIQLEFGGLESALSNLCSNIEKLFQISCRFQTTLPLDFLDSPTATHLYRIAQEAVDNAVRHGGAGKIEIAFEHHYGRLQLCIRDNGRGIPKLVMKSGGMGLSNMTYRGKLLGGDVTIKSNIPRGTEVICDVPFRSN